TMRNGLTTNIVNSAHKDDKGFIWFTTDDCISRYDGVRFTNFSSEKNPQLGLEENIFFQIYQHSPDTLLFLSYSGQLHAYDYKKGKFSNLSKSDSLLSKVVLTSLIKSRSDKSYWFSTNRGIINTTSRFRVIKEYPIPNRDKNRTVTNKVNTIFMDKDAVLWLGMLSRGIYRFDTKRKEFIIDKVNSIVPKNQQVNSFCADNNSVYIFVATGGEGLIRINTKNFSYVKWRYNANNVNTLPSDRITTLLLQGDSLLWIGTIDGLAKLNLRKNITERFINNPLDQYSLCNNSINHIYLDNQNVLWISTAGGISRLNTNPIRFRKISQNALQKNSLSSNRISQCFTDKKGNLWIESANGINLKAKEENYFHHYSLPKSFKTHKNEEVIKIFADGDTWWIGTWGGGISRVTMPKNFKPGNQLQFTNFYNEVNDKSSISSNFIRDFCTDEKGNLWISTWNGGLNKIKTEDKLKSKISFQRFISHGNPEKSVASDFIDAIVSDSAGILWLGTSEGLQYCDYERNTFSIVYSGSKKEEITSVPTSIVIDKKKNIWFSHFTGISRIKKASDGSYLSENII
ncbi:MAG: two-component regulator propeller domain-containing protein, partial [Ignavibacteria bacterium]|nr:two-component regulator propeller domain-containing protein [Ignavibacteria bacterium]